MSSHVRDWYGSVCLALFSIAKTRLKKISNLFTCSEVPLLVLACLRIKCIFFSRRRADSEKGMEGMVIEPIYPPGNYSRRRPVGRDFAAYYCSKFGEFP